MQAMLPRFFFVISPALFAEYDRLSLARLETCAAPSLLAITPYMSCINACSPCAGSSAHSSNINDTTSAL